MSEVLEHFLAPDRAIRDVKESLKPNGVLILTTPTPLFGPGTAYEIERLFKRGKFNFSYINRLFKRKLKENHLIKSDDTMLARFGIRGYVFRHDAYLPLGLQDYIESFGFKCYRYYTIRYSRYTLVELASRKIPLINLLGKTNVMLFTKRLCRKKKP